MNKTPDMGGTMTIDEVCYGHDKATYQLKMFRYLMAKLSSEKKELESEIRELRIELYTLREEITRLEE